MSKTNELPTLEADDDDRNDRRERRRRPQPRGLAPFVIIKRGLAVFAALGGVAMLISLSRSPVVGQTSENTQILSYIFAAIPIAVGAWLWGGSDPD